MTEKVSDTKIKKIKDLKTQHPDWGCRRVAKAVDLHYVTVSKKLKELGLNQPERSPKRNNPRLSHSSNPTKPSPNWKEAFVKSEKSFGALIPRGYQEKTDETPNCSVKPELKINKTYYTDQDYGDGGIGWEAIALIIGIPAAVDAAVWGIPKLRDWLTKRRAERERKKMGDKEAPISTQKFVEEWAEHLRVPPHGLK
jgi:hypothetical protein